MTKILVCGSFHSGSERILRLLIHIFKQNHIPLNVIQDYQQNVDSNKLDDDTDTSQTTIVVCHNFWEIYEKLKVFDHIILCIRDCRSICKSMLEMIKVCEQIQCWSIFSKLVLKYEMYGPSQVADIVTLLSLSFSYGEIISLVEKVRIIGIPKNPFQWNDYQIKHTFLVNKFLEDHEYYAPEMKEKPLQHSVSWS